MINHGPDLAKDIIYKYCIHSIEELRLEEIINAEGLVIKEVDFQGIYGKLASFNDCGIIYINRNIRETGMKRFTLAHEFGHFLIFKKRGIYSHIFRSQVYSRKSPEEREADAFAAELLMHKPWFNNFIRDRTIDMDLIKDIANYFNVTLTAAAMRYANIGQFPIAVVITMNGKIISYFINECFPYRYLKLKIGRETGVYRMLQNNENITEKILIEPYYWFEDKKLNYGNVINKIWEQSIYLKYYGLVLTILWEYNPYQIKI